MILNLYFKGMVMSQITVDQLQRALPRTFKNKATQALADKINNINCDPAFRAQYRENILSYIHVLKEGKFKMESYLDAVRYVSYKLMNMTNIDAYIRTFPKRYQYFINNNTSEGDIASYVSSYNKNKLVNLIYEYSMIPTHVLNQDLFQKALNVQANLMLNAKSEKVQSDAADSILKHLKPPESKKVELEITNKASPELEELRAATQKLVEEQKLALQNKTMNAKDIAHSRIIEGESEVVN